MSAIFIKKKHHKCVFLENLPYFFRYFAISAATFAGVKPNFSSRTLAGALSPKWSKPMM